MSRVIISRDEPKFARIRAACAGCGGLIEEGEPRLVTYDDGTVTMRHDACERKGTLPLFRGGTRAVLMGVSQ